MKTFREFAGLEKKKLFVLIQNDTFTLKHLFQMQIFQGLISQHFSNLGLYVYDLTVRPF